jgi:hypothetical protein
MNDLSSSLDHAERDVLNCEISDAALERAAAVAADGIGAVTLSFCTGLDTCPA